jgi:hypothetical protein
MINANFILLIFNCNKYKYKAKLQKDTWLHNFTLMPYFHVIGDPELTTDYNFVFEENILYVKTNDDYVSLPKKVISAYEAINKEYVFNYIFKTDDDQHLNSTQFLHMIQRLLLTKYPKVHYGGHIITINSAHLSQYHKIHPELPPNLPMFETTYCSGRFYVLSDLAVHQLVSKKTSISNEYFEDYAIGYNLDPILKKNMLNIQTNRFFIDNTFDEC